MPAGDFSARSVRSSAEVSPKLGASLLDFDLRRANVLNRVVMDFAWPMRKRNSTIRQQGERAVLLLLIWNALESSFAAHIEIFHDNLCRFAIGADGKSDAASANSVFVLRLIGERVAIIVFHWEGLVFRALHNRETSVLLDDRDVTKEIVRVPSKVGAIFRCRRGRSRRFGIIEAEHRPDRRRIGKSLFKEDQPIMRRLVIQRQSQNGAATTSNSIRFSFQAGRRIRHAQIVIEREIPIPDKLSTPRRYPPDVEIASDALTVLMTYARSSKNLFLC